MSVASLMSLRHRLKKYLLEGGASTVFIHDDLELSQALCVCFFISITCFNSKLYASFKKRLLNPHWHWVPHPAGDIGPTFEDCLGYQWAHTPSFYFAIRRIIGDRRGKGFPAKMVPLPYYAPPPDHQPREFHNTLMKNVRKNKRKAEKRFFKGSIPAIFS